MEKSRFVWNLCTALSWYDSPAHVLACSLAFKLARGFSKLDRLSTPLPSPHWIVWSLPWNLGCVSYTTCSAAYLPKVPMVQVEEATTSLKQTTSSIQDVQPFRAGLSLVHYGLKQSLGSMPECDNAPQLWARGTKAYIGDPEFNPNPCPFRCGRTL